MDRITKSVVSTILGFATTALSFLFLVPAGCNDVGGVPSWERCTSIMGTPAFSVEDLGWDNTLDVIAPILMGVIMGIVTWRLLGMSRDVVPDDRPDTSPKSQQSKTP